MPTEGKILIGMIAFILLFGAWHRLITPAPKGGKTESVIGGVFSDAGCLISMALPFLIIMGIFAGAAYLSKGIGVTAGVATIVAVVIVMVIFGGGGGKSDGNAGYENRPP